MKFNLRKVLLYAACSIEIENQIIDLGMLDRQQAAELLEDFRNAAEELDWFLAVTDAAKEQT